MKQEALIGRTIAGKFEIETLVGQGAMGSVYRARQITLGTTLAIKVLHRQLAGEPMFAARFLREAQAASRVDHPSSMRVIDFGEEADGLLYIAMEYVDGNTLAKIIEEESPLPVARIVDIACQALAALAVAHDIGVIHRDLKPENIMVIEGKDDEGRIHDIVKVCDFGVAKLLEGGSRAPSVTAQGVVVGTPEYMSPEQARGDGADARSDIYAMGVLLFHMMTGKVPFDSSTAFGTAFMHVNDEPTRPRLLNPRVDSRLEKICLKAMRKRPEDRFASARELRGELRALLGHDDAYSDEPIAEPPISGGLLQQIETRPRRGGLMIAGVVLAASVVAGGILYPRASTKTASSAHEPVQSATITAGVLPGAHPAAAVPPPDPPKVVDTTAASGPGSDATSVAPFAPSRTHVASKSNARRAPGGKARNGVSIPIGVDEIPQLPDPNAPSALPAPKGKNGKTIPDAAPKPDATKPAAAKPDATKPDAAAKPDATKPDAAAKPAPAKPDAAAKPDAPKADAPPAKPDAAKPEAAKPALPAEPPADKPKAAPAAKPDPADMPLPVFPIPGDAPSPKP